MSCTEAYILRLGYWGFRMTWLDLCCRESCGSDWVGAWTNPVIHLESVRLGEAFDSRAEELQALRLSLCLEIALVASMVGAWARSLVVVIALE